MSETDFLTISPDLSLPRAAVTETFAILAKRGVGKTYTSAVITEEMSKAGLQVVIADPVGVWWGLRSSADGKKAGLSIVVFGGEHGDLPLHADSGELVAGLIIQERISAVLDLSLLRKGEQKRFMMEFAEKLYHSNREAMHLVLDEADAWAPQRPLPGDQRLLGAIEDLVRRGRARGIGITLISQRPAVLNKDVLTQCEVMIALRIVGKQDRDAIKAWCAVHGSEEDLDEFADSIASLPIGTAWFWSPGWLHILKKVAIRKRETFDSSATPEAGKSVIEPKVLAAVDLAALGERIASTIERAKETDPKELQARIRSLQQQLDKQKPAEPVIQTVEVPVVTPEVAELLSRTVDNLHAMAKDMAQSASEIAACLRQAKGSPPPVIEKTRPITRIEDDAPPRREASEPGAREDISKPRQRILGVLAELSAIGLAEVRKELVAVFAGVSPTSSGYTNNLGALRSQDLIRYPRGGHVALTSDGERLAGETEPFISLAEYHSRWMKFLSAPQQRIVDNLIMRYPDAIHKGDLAGLVGQSVTSSGYTNNLGRLRSLGLVGYPAPGMVVATELLFPEGLR